MSAIDTRSLGRDSLFLMADVRVEGRDETCRLKVRNLSNGGMMGEGTLEAIRGQRVTVELRNIGTVSGSVAWTQGSRIGIAFDEEVDARVARNSASATGEAMIVRRNGGLWSPPNPQDMRKV